MPSASSASNVFFSDDLPEASGSNYQLLNTISPQFPKFSAEEDLQPTQTASQRRGVAWSENIDSIKFFYKADSIHPSPGSPTKSHAPPSSIRSYLHEQDLNTPQSTPLFRSNRKFTSSPLSASSSSPSKPRSILKPRVSEIRVASSVEEGGWLNKEPARLIVCGKRPRIVARDSFQLAKMRVAPVEAVEGKGKGKARAHDIQDQAVNEGEMETEEGGEKDGESEEEEEAIEEGGALMTASLVDIILNGAEDLLTLDEAYTTLTLRLRSKLAAEVSSDLASSLEESIRIAVHPVREEAPAIVRAVQRDLGRLLGRVSGLTRPTERESSPFSELQPLQDSSPSSESSNDSAKRRQGYTEAEIRYRREAAQVGQSALKFLATVFRAPQLHECFSEADLATLLEQAMIIPRTTKMPTFSPKRSYRWSIFLLSQMRIPAISVNPAQEKIVSVVEAAMNGALVPAGCTRKGKEDELLRKEGVNAVVNLIITYPTLFLHHYATLLPPLIRGMYDPIVETRMSSSAACAAFASAKINMQSMTTSALISDATPAARQEWQKVKTLVQKMEFWVSAHFKATIKDTGPLVERKTHAAMLVLKFRELVGTADGVLWSCATWSVVISLMGGAYANSGMTIGMFDHIMDRALQMTANATRPILARASWNHAIHAYLAATTTTSVSADNQLIRSYNPFLADADESAKRTHLLQLPVDLALAAANVPDAATKVLYKVSDGTEERYMWQRIEKGKNRKQCIVTCGSAATVVIYAYTGMALHHQDQPAKDDVPSDSMSNAETSTSTPLSQIQRLDETWNKVVRPILVGLLTVEGLPDLQLTAWDILIALTSLEPPTSTWSLDKLLSNRYLNGSAFIPTQESTSADFMLGLEGDAMKPKEVPACGAEWIVKHLANMLDLLQTALVGVQGMDKVDLCGARTQSGEAVIPSHLSRIWRNLLKALTSVRHVQPEAFDEGLHLVARRLMVFWELDPTTYLAASAFGPRGCIQDIDETRIRLFERLLDIAVEELGRTSLGEPTSKSISASTFLISSIGHSPSFPALILSTQKDSLSTLVTKLIDLSHPAPIHAQLRADLEHTLPCVLVRDELRRLTDWVSLTSEWRAILDVNNASSSPASVAPDVAEKALISLLISPFRLNVWYAPEAEEHSALWAALLGDTVRQFRTRNVDVNSGLLDKVAGTLAEIFDVDGERSASTISLCCISSMITEMASATTGACQLPSNLLSILGLALLHSHPHNQSQSASPESQSVISPGVDILIQSLAAAFSSLPACSADQILRPDVRDALQAWLGSSLPVPLLATTLDKCYCATLDLLSSAIIFGDLQATGETLDQYSAIYGTRLAHAESRAVLMSFERFWRAGFSGVDLELSERVRLLLLDVMKAMPGLIEVNGLVQEETMDEEESQRRFPHSQGLVAEMMTRPLVPASDPVAMEESAIANEKPGAMQDYDADISTSSAVLINDTIAFVQIEEPPQQLGSPLAIDSFPPSSPVRVEDSAESSEPAAKAEVEVEAEAVPSDDVFGPPSMVGRRKRHQPLQTRALSVTQSYPDMSRSKRARIEERVGGSLQLATTIIPDSQEEGEKTEEDEDGDDVEVVEEKMVLDKSKGKSKEVTNLDQGGSIINRLLTKATSFGFFSSPHRRIDEPAFEIIPASEFVSRNSQKRAAASDPAPRPSSSTKKPRSERPKSRRSRSDGASSQSSSRSGSASSDAIVVSEDEDKAVDVDDEEYEDNDDDDASQPTPETAKRRRVYDITNGGILHKSKLNPSPAHRPKRRNAKKVTLPTPTQGRFDDASEESLHVPQAVMLPNASPVRTVQQARVLSMVEEASRAKAAVESLDFDGVMSLLKHVNELRDAATANLQERAIRERSARR